MNFLLEELYEKERSNYENNWFKSEYYQGLQQAETAENILRSTALEPLQKHLDSLIDGTSDMANASLRVGFLLGIRTGIQLLQEIPQRATYLIKNDSFYYLHCSPGFRKKQGIF